MISIRKLVNNSLDGIAAVATKAKIKPPKPPTLDNVNLSQLLNSVDRDTKLAVLQLIIKREAARAVQVEESSNA